MHGKYEVRMFWFERMQKVLGVKNHIKPGVRTYVPVRIWMTLSFVANKIALFVDGAIICLSF